MDQQRYEEFLINQKKQNSIDQSEVYKTQLLNHAISNLPGTKICPGAPLLKNQTLVLN